MGSKGKYVIFAMAVTALLATAACKSNGSYREHQKTQGEEVEAMEERGNTAIDAADETEE